MADMSFKCWHIAINCDHPTHPRKQPPPGHIEEVDFIDTEPDLSKRDWRDNYRAKGFVFHRDGRVTCPDCAQGGVTRMGGDGEAGSEPKA